MVSVIAVEWEKMKAQLRVACRYQARNIRRIRRNVGFLVSEQLIIFTVIFPDTFLKSVA
ncbi:hypothetical protein BN136_1723 [Cronobacter universalis NCTC 9529]|uniref:Transposase n=1 Tax=Cronobacter universalis NCTC 9529 TaxID=1074000 RepID=A0ABY1W5P8_9ENTR|nr:hypothetical protein [Cronobacter universalis]CCK15713.1 hypothetical protein BN136_1723 [Cronobacter universalis NCTC 9529]STD15012.1 Uncharacterised protein [Cronobacter universalis NCTC 9529]